MLGTTLAAGPYLRRVCREIERLDLAQVERLSDRIEDAYRAGRFVFVVGNGGSGATASHLCEDLAKCTLRDFERQRRLKVLSLTDNASWLMAIANDLDYSRIFVEQLRNLASPGDLLIAISGSGNSPNVLKAVEWANANGLRTYGVTGFAGGRLREIAHDGLHVPIDDMGVVESIHLTVFHWVIDDLNRRFAAEGSEIRGQGPGGSAPDLAA
jgi:D-sedoheptulose 7-phosphate isomerase